tara:strand:+ start:3369 stop:3953 length:585 start_codon:yes stop_codon:yes gene_type:complete
MHRILRVLPSICALALLTLGLSACGAKRILVVESTPSEALVRLDEEIIGVTPLEFPFEHYGDRRLSLYLDGYDTWSEPIELKTPWYSRFPLDLVTEVLLPIRPVTRPTFHIHLSPMSEEVTLPDIENFADEAHALHLSERELGAAYQAELERIAAEEAAAAEALNEVAPPGPIDTPPEVPAPDDSVPNRGGDPR